LSKIIEKIRELRFPAVSFRPSPSLIAFILIAVAIFILGGGVYDIMEHPPSVLPTPTSPQFYYPGMTDQTLNESMIFIFLLIIGISGGYISFRSTRHAYRPREARMFLAVGIAMMVVAFIGCEVLMDWKGL
jgi:hypothetical protein